MNKHILIPHKKPTNPFFEQVIAHSTWQFDYGDLQTAITNYDVVLIHWPELLFGWKEPVQEELDALEQQFKIWKGAIKIVYVMHNERPHSGMTSNFQRLYDLVLDYSDTMVHMGRYGLDKYQRLYPNTGHVVIPHAIYEAPFKVYNKLEARKQLGLSPDKKILLAAGAIRNLEERQLIIKAFKKLRLKHKFLIVPKMFYKEVAIKFPGRYALKRIFDIKKTIENIYNKNNNHAYCFNYGYTDYEKLSLYFSAADVIMIPRINTLNSGNVFLAMTYNKVVIGPDVGHISEVLKASHLPVFQPENKTSVVTAIESGFTLESEGFSYEAEELQNYSSKNIGTLWDDVLNHIIKDIS